MISKLVFSILLLTSCASKITYKDLMFSDAYDLQPRKSLSEQQKHHDIDILIYALENAYGARKYVDQDKLALAKKNLNVLNINARDSKEFCDFLADAMQVVPDSHLMIRIGPKKCGAYRFPKASVGVNFAKQRKIPWELNYIKIGKDQIPVFSITSFPSYEDEVWKGYEEAVKKLRDAKRAVIIDLRGNQGGDDSRGHQLANYMYGQDYASVGGFRIKSQTPETFAIRSSGDKLKMFNYQNKKEPIPAYLQTHYDNEVSMLEKALANELPPEDVREFDQGKTFDKHKAYTKPIYILMDRECASSCEGTLEAFEQHPNATTIGENSAGFIHFGNNAKFVLPESQVQVQMAADFWKFGDGRYKEIVGYDPKIRINSGEDALTKALELIKQKRSKNIN